jgi:hypothetical protein
MGLLTEKYTAWAKHPQNYTAEQVLNQIVADLKWLDEEQAKNCSIPAVMSSCKGNCGMNYCDDNGCIERKRILVEPTDLPEHGA